MQKTKLLLLAILLAGGCKKKEDPPAAPPPVVMTADAALVEPVDSGSNAGFVFSTGESYFGGKATPTNVMEWKLSDGSVLTLVVVQVGTADGRQQGVLRVYRDGKGVDIGERFSVSASGDNWVELKQLPNGRVAFRFGDATED